MGEIELETAVGIVLIKARHVCNAYFWSLQLTGLSCTLGCQ